MQDHILYFGHSHANNFKNAVLDSRSNDSDQFSYRAVAAGNAAFVGGIVVRDIHGNVIVNPLILSALAGNAKRQDRRIWLCSIAHGNFANRRFLIQGSELVDTFLPEFPDLPFKEGSRPLPFDLLCDQFREDMKLFSVGLEALKRLPVAGVLHVGPAAPVFDNAELRKLLSPQTIAAAQKRGLSEHDIQISDPYLRYKAWVSECTVVQEICSQHGVELVSAPAESCDELGFRKAEFAADAVHGNTDYGGLLVKEVERTISRLRDSQDD